MTPPPTGRAARTEADELADSRTAPTEPDELTTITPQSLSRKASDHYTARTEATHPARDASGALVRRLAQPGRPTDNACRKTPRGSQVSLARNSFG